ncbi:MAG TPA: integrase, partial [Dehalococcoidia bacterium]|nr:integrase [Dehalococcoidia bacterium]
MPSNERMNINERRKYLKLVRSRYVQSGRKERSQLLTEMGEVTGLKRK